MDTTVAMDPKVAAIMARLEQAEKKKDKEVETKVEQSKAPTTHEEFMNCEKLEEWPSKLTSEGPMDIEGEALLLGSKQDISNLLRDAAPLGLDMLESLQDRLDMLDQRLNNYATQIVTDDKRPSRLQDNLFYAPSRAFMTEVSESDAVKSHHSSKGHKSLPELAVRVALAAEEAGVRKKTIADFVDSLMETRKKSLEYCTFPGFRHGELVELPGQLEAPPILHRVTKAQDFNPGFKKFWKKIFLSEASVAVMQDTFWWYFLNKFDDAKNIDKNLLYDRIADSFVALFTSINKDVKDKFLMAYPDCLAQGIFSAFWEAFPESRAQFGDDFRQELLNLVCEWTTGLKPVPGTWKNWKVKRLQSKPLKGLEKEASKTAEQMMHAAALNKEFNYSLDIESFEKMVDHLGKERAVFASTPTIDARRDVTKMPTIASSLGPATVSVSRLATAGTEKRKPVESHQIGPGPVYERVKFNTEGRSPLISHYLHLRQLKDFHQHGRKIRRTEIVTLPAPGLTYKQLIQNTLNMSNALSKEYQKICEQTDQEIRELERKQRDTNREFNALTRDLMFTKNPVDLRILSDKILGLRDRDRDTPLLDDETESALNKGSPNEYDDDDVDDYDDF